MHDFTPINRTILFSTNWAASSNIETLSASLQLGQMKSKYKCHKYIIYEILSNIPD